MSKDTAVSQSHAVGSRGERGQNSGGLNDRSDSHPSSRAAHVGAGAASAIFALIAAFHLAVAAGAPLGEYTQGGANQGVLPQQGRIIAGVSATIVLVLAAAILARGEQGALRKAPHRLSAVFSWIATTYAGVGIVLNLITPSATERAIWAPVTMVLFAACLVTMLATRRTSRYSRASLTVVVVPSADAS
ncbi:hypothetical protein [Salinibacterium sp. UTAS2018]|uniref:hypothetical protein n=1 Tax=Salinibacterium sp. UTAS2018 TaxID=2508880 RepID=UPI001AEF9030|nr:hypothetical protein [Salinibacterium sp. UTAS2018]